ncbi:MAG: PIN domain-containing protein [Euryarchaeota archaeon]|nr:PIN domain-containing protein [Euryarchaeota archaeon]
MTTYLFDTYAFLKLYEGARSYERYLREDFVTTALQIIELHYKLRKMADPDADAVVSKFCRLEEITCEDVVEGMKVKEKMPELSPADAIGYAVARRLGIPFLTGDGPMRKLPGVEFVR